MNQNNIYLFEEAVKTQNYDELMKYVISHQDIENSNAIVIACKNNSYDMVEWLLKKKIYNEKNIIEAYIQSFKNGNLYIIKLLLNEYPISLDYDDNCFIKISCKNGYEHLVKYLLESHEVNPCTMNNYPLKVAADKGYYKIVGHLLNHEMVDPSFDKNNIIGRACQRNNLKTVKLLLNDSRVDPSDNDNYALKISCEKGYSNIVDELVKDNRVDVSTNNNYPLKIAAKNGYTKVVKILLKKRVSAEEGIIEAFKNNRSKIAKLLIKKIPLKKINKVFKKSCVYGNLDISSFIVLNNLTQSEETIKNGIKLAAQNGYFDIVRFLLEYENIYNSVFVS